MKLDTLRKITVCRHEYYEGDSVKLFVKELRRMDLIFEKYFALATAPKPYGRFDETWYKGKSHYADVHIVR
jgi:hypothetical protein